MSSSSSALRIRRQNRAGITYRSRGGRWRISPEDVEAAVSGIAGFLGREQWRLEFDSTAARHCCPASTYSLLHKVTRFQSPVRV
eukprot:3057812-Rhodomonas_salina.2